MVSQSVVVRLTCADNCCTLAPDWWGCDPTAASKTGGILMLQPENQSKKYQNLFIGIDSGQIKIPRF